MKHKNPSMILSLPNKKMDKNFTLTKLIGVECAYCTTSHFFFGDRNAAKYGAPLLCPRIWRNEASSKPTTRANTFLVTFKSCKLWNPLPLLSIWNSKIIIERFIDVNKYSLNCVWQQTWEQDYKAAMWSVELCVKRVHYP